MEGSFHGSSSSEGNLADIKTVGLKEFLYKSEKDSNYVNGNHWQFCVLSLVLLYVHLAYVNTDTVKRNLRLVLVHGVAIRWLLLLRVSSEF